MPYDTLETIHDSALPILFTSPTEANLIRSYVAAGLVIAQFQDLDSARAKGERPGAQATVSAITPAGRKTVARLRDGRSLKKFRQGK